MIYTKKFSAVRGLVKLRKTRIGQATPTHPRIQFFSFFETFGNMKTTQKTHKKH